MAALSVINFRMKQTSKVAPAAEKVEQILFSGNGIKLIDLKKEIAEKKKFSNNLDYDLTVTDENGKGFTYIAGLFMCKYLRTCKFVHVCMYVE